MLVPSRSRAIQRSELLISSASKTCQRRFAWLGVAVQLVAYEQQLKDKKTKAKLQRSVDHAKKAAMQAAKAEILHEELPGWGIDMWSYELSSHPCLLNRRSLQAEGLEKTYKFSQAELKQHVDQSSARKVQELLCRSLNKVSNALDIWFEAGRAWAIHPSLFKQRQVWLDSFDRTVIDNIIF